MELYVTITTVSAAQMRIKLHCLSCLYMTITLSYLISSHLISYHLISSHLISSHLISSHLISSHLISSHLISSHLISSHLISSHLISSHLISSHLISSHLISSHLYQRTQSLSEDLDNMSRYLNNWRLKINTGKTVCTSFHLAHRLAKYQLQVTCEGQSSHTKTTQSTWE